jgi:hypothetical protein
MIRPSIVSQAMGAPGVAALLFLGYVVIGLAWYEHYINFLPVVAAIFAAKRTITAVNEVRRYKEWQANFNMVVTGDAHAPKGSTFAHRARVAASLLSLWVAWQIQPPAQFLHEAAGNEMLRTGFWALWIAVCVYMGLGGIGKLVAIARRVASKPRAVAKNEPAVVPVSWTLNRAASSPSRSEATAQLPEYCAAMLKR